MNRHTKLGAVSHALRPRPDVGATALLAAVAGVVTGVAVWSPLASAQTTDVVELTVADVQAGLAGGSFTSVGLVESFLERTRQFDDYYKSYISFNPEAMSQAAALDAEYRTSGPRSPLHGVPVVIKDNMDYAGLVTTNGYAGFSGTTNGIDIRPEFDASVTARLKSAGAVILGKTNLPDFAFDGLRSNSTVRGVTRNASNPDRAPGGSSGGTATAVNASFAVLGLGTETGRSIHNPSSFQALVGIRPSQGLVPIDGIAPLNGTFRDVAGPIAKTVYDAAVTLDALAGPSARDRLSLVSEIPIGGYTSQLSTTALQGKRVGTFDPQFLPLRVGGVPTFRTLDAPTQTLYDAATLDVQGQGATLVSTDLFDQAWVDYFFTQPGVQNPVAFDQWAYFQQLGSTNPFNTIEEYFALVRADPDVPDTYADNYPNARVTSTQDPLLNPTNTPWLRWRAGLRKLFDEIMDENDLDGFFWPVSGRVAPTLATTPPGGNNNDPLVQGVINILGIPGVIVNSGYYDDGTPFGTIFFGRRWDEAGLLGLAFDYEQATMLRQAPTLIPEPSTVVSLTTLGGGLLLRRRRDA